MSAFDVTGKPKKKSHRVSSQWLAATDEEIAAMIHHLELEPAPGTAYPPAMSLADFISTASCVLEADDPAKQVLPLCTHTPVSPSVSLDSARK